MRIIKKYSKNKLKNNSSSSSQNDYNQIGNNEAPLIKDKVEFTLQPSNLDLIGDNSKKIRSNDDDTEIVSKKSDNLNKLSKDLLENKENSLFLRNELIESILLGSLVLDFNFIEFLERNSLDINDNIEDIKSLIISITDKNDTQEDIENKIIDYIKCN